ncbi:hypothetical protein [Streptomyces sp. NPDC091371]|uniref:hypothetical protein n=1 Tax=Streptomyces sp. NPDC091371 TaxID=3155303 RepID=UPI003429AAA9
MLVAATLSGCSMLPGSGSGSGSEKKADGAGRTYQEAMDAMYPGVLDAMKPAMPGIEPDERGNGKTECGGPDFLDGKDASKLVASQVIDLTGPASDRRPPEELLDGVVSRLTIQDGWKAQERRVISPAGHPDGVTQQVMMPGSGVVMISASPFRTTSGEIIPKLTANVVTDCLRNPAWRHG